MKQEIKHRRLHAFYQSKVLNSLMIVVIIGLLQMGYSESAAVPVVYAGVAFALFLAYALWLWICKPQRIVINNWLSNMNGCFTLYYLIIIAMKAENMWWYIFPTVCAIFTLFIAMTKPHDEVFEI